MRRGVPVVVETAAGAWIALAAETARDAILRALTDASGQAGDIVLTHPRAKTLKIRLYTPGVVAVPLAPGTDAAAIRAIADPAGDLTRPMKGPFAARRGTLSPAHDAAVKLAKLAGLLPAAVLHPYTEELRASHALRGILGVAAADIAAYDTVAARTLELVVRARVPLAGAPGAELAVFRPADGGPEHYAILIGSPAPPGPVLVRLHSECFTGDLLGSLRCDCGEQLRGAVGAIAAAGAGVLLYLAQEGRGIGLMNKLRAYRLQDQGFDTMEANERLGFAPDERLYDAAARMLAELGFDAVRLLTNNPAKVAGLEAAGIRVAERVPHSFPDNEHNRAYLRAKSEKGGHLL